MALLFYTQQLSHWPPQWGYWFFVCVYVFVCVSLLVCVCVVQGGYSFHWEHSEGLKDGGGEEEGACFILSVGGERLVALFQM